MDILADLLMRWEFYTTIFALFIVTRVIKWLTDPLRRIPGPVGYPIIGNTLDYSLSRDLHRILLERAKKYGKIYKDYSILAGTSVFITDPEYAKQVLVTNSTRYHRSTLLRKVLPGLGNGLVTINGKEHATQRKHLNPAFSLSSVKEFISIFNQKGNELLTFFEDQMETNKGQPIETEMMTKFTDMTLDVIGKCGFGYDFNCVFGGNNEERKATNTILSANFNIVQRSFEELFPPIKLIPSKQREEIKKSEDILNGLIKKVIESRRMEMMEHPGETLEKTDLLQKLITMYEEAGTSISNKDLFHQVFTFMLAGHETTSLTFTWTIFLLAKHPELQERARKEVQGVLEGMSDVSFDDLDKMKFLDDCIKESMRLYPVAILIGRNSVKEDKIGPYTIPANTRVLVNVGAMNRSPSHWQNPDEFHPERFSKQGDKDSLFPYYYAPFSRGPRMCIGYRFAQMELKVVMALLLNKFSFKLGKSQPADISGILTLTLKPNPPPVIEISKV